MRVIDADKLHFSPRFAWTTPDREEMVPVLAVDKKWIDKAPTVDAVEVVHGRWIHKGAWHIECSECQYILAHIGEAKNYCPNCGATMDGGNEDG